MSIIRYIRMAAVAVALAVPGSSSVAQESLASYMGPDREQRLEHAAKNEGMLTLYTSTAQKDIAPLVEPFERKYGIKVKVWRSGSENVLHRTLTEARANKHEVDIVQTASPEMETLFREDVLLPVESPAHASLIPGALRPHHGWAASFLAVWVQAYNTNLLKKEDLPKTYDDLLDPKWKGKLGIEAQIPEWYATVVGDMGEENGISFFQTLAAQNGLSARKGHSLLNNLVVAGEVPLALTVYNYLPEQAKKKGAPIDWFVLDPAVARASGAGVLANAPNPNAALLFYDYLLSEEAQRVFRQLDYVPTNKNVPSPLHKMRTTLVDPVQVLDEAEKWEASFESVIKQGKP